MLAVGLVLGELFVYPVVGEDRIGIGEVHTVGSWVRVVYTCGCTRVSLYGFWCCVLCFRLVIDGI